MPRMRQDTPVVDGVALERLPQQAMTTFDRATALSSLAVGRFGGVISEEFWVQVGPNGGYLTAIALRGAAAIVPEPSRLPRSIHVRFLSPPRAGGFELHASEIRRGRSMTTVGVRMDQEGKTFLEASACFSEPFSPIQFQDARMPEALALEAGEPLPKLIPLNHHYDLVRAIGGALRTNPQARTGGYLRFSEPRPIDTLALAALWDAWPPAVFARAIEQRFRGAVPTVEASCFFRAPSRVVPAGEHVLMKVESTTASDGFVEEDAELWSQDGVLLAQSRQLALLM
jgi:acyl-CoA thioesterase